MQLPFVRSFPLTYPTRHPLHSGPGTLFSATRRMAEFSGAPHGRMTSYLAKLVATDAKGYKFDIKYIFVRPYNTIFPLGA